MKRIILHCDCNNFFASVETVFNPTYRGVPMAVCGSEEDRHGIVLAKNEIAKRYGIKTAETVYSARKKCPDLVIAKPHHRLYSEYSRKVNEIYSRYTDRIEPFGIDESWLDISGSRILNGDGVAIANRIREEVKQELGITVSVGVSFNKVFAKLGSDYKKPDAVTLIDESNYKDIVFPLPASDLLFVGKKTAKMLETLGIKTIGALANASEEILNIRLGKMGTMLHKYANGLDDDPVARIGEREDVKSVGSGHTFRRNITGIDEWREGLSYLSEDVARRLRKQGMKCTTVQVTVKDEFLITIQRQRRINPATDISSEISDTALLILKDAWRPDTPIRALTVTALNLVKTEHLAEQIDMFALDNDKLREKKKEKELAVDKIRQKFGSSAIKSGLALSDNLHMYGGEEEIPDFLLDQILKE